LFVRQRHPAAAKLERIAATLQVVAALIERLLDGVSASAEVSSMKNAVGIQHQDIDAPQALVDGR
jgi:hypothetical protein